MTRTAVWPLWALGAILVGLAAWGAVVVDHFDDPRIGYFTLAQAPFYALAAAFVVARPPQRRGHWLAIILVFGLAMRLLLLPGPPVSTDIFRYVWDGRVQGAGINPYLYIPADAALRSLRDDIIYPNINRADYAPTIYPPAAQVVFFLVTRISESIYAMKAAMVGFEAIAAWAIIRLLQARGQPVTNVLLYVWHPLPVWEFARSGHVDAVGIAMLMLAFVAAMRRSPVLAGVTLGVGALVKYYPIVAGPALYRRWDWRLPLACLATVLVLYLPYVGAGTRVLGFLPHYVTEERFDAGVGFFLWRALDAMVSLPRATVALYAAGASAIMLALALIVVLRERKFGVDLMGAMVLATAFVFLLSPHYVWYFAWLVPFLCFYPSVAVLYLTCAANLMYLGHAATWLHDGLIIYGGFGLLLAGELLVRRQLGQRLAFFAFGHGSIPGPTLGSKSGPTSARGPNE